MSSLVMIHTGGLGDFLQTLPVLAAIRETRPAARVTVIGHTSRACLAVAGGLADSVTEFETSGLHRLFQTETAKKDLPAVLHEADVILSFLGHETFTRNLARLAPATVVTGRSFPAPGDTALPAAQFVYDQVAGQLGLPDREAVPCLRLTAEWRESGPAVASGVRDTVAIHPGSGDRTKNWPFGCYQDLSRRLAADGLDTIWLLGPAEVERTTFDLPEGDRSLRCADLRKVAAVLTKVRCYVGNDSGVTHLAAALGTPTVALFGPSDPAVWAPRGSHVRVVTGPGGNIQRIRLEDIVCASAEPCTRSAAPARGP